MDSPKRIQRKRTKGWRMPEGTVSVARPGKWGNPFRVEHYGARGAVERFRLYISATPERIAITQQLRGKDLACWCPADAPHCHADVLLELANAPAPSPETAPVTDTEQQP